jgi:outer membrane protein assembly factor BamB
MRRLAICFAIVAAANTSRAAELERVSLQGLLEGSSLGDLDGDGRSEIIALLRDGSAADATWSNGSVVALDAKGAVLWERKGDQYLSGGLSAADFDGDGQGEVAYCEASASGNCMVVDGDGELLWQTPSAYYPGISGVAPASADLTHDGAQDLVTNSWGGTIAAYDGPTGFELWHFDAYTELGELFHSNPTLFDLNGDHTHDVILVGSQKGYVVALDGVDGNLL